MKRMAKVPWLIDLVPPQEPDTRTYSGDPHRHGYHCFESNKVKASQYNVMHHRWIERETDTEVLKSGGLAISTCSRTTTG